MKSYATYRFALLLSALVLGLSLSACNSKLDQSTMNDVLTYQPELSEPTNHINIPSSTNSQTGTTNTLSPTVIPSESSSNTNANTSEITGTDIVTPPPLKEPSMLGEELNVRGVTILMGETTDQLVRKLGIPNRIADTEFDFDYYIYNNDYSRLLFVAVKDNRIVGYYSDSIDFSFNGIRSGADITTVGDILNQSFSLAEVLTSNTKENAISVLMDVLGTKKATGIYVLSNSITQDGYTDSVIQNIELMIYDLTNSARVRNKEAVLSWSSSAALASRKHSLDMAVNNYFDHISPAGTKPGDRMKAEGIAYSTYGENIIAGYGTAIISNHGWYNSPGHRKNMLNPNFRYLGVGFTYQADSTYNSYITQNFYR